MTASEMEVINARLDRFETAVFGKLDEHGRIISQLATTQASQQSTCQAMCAMHRRVHETVFGDGDDKLGHNVRIDRLEQRSELRSKGFWAMVALVSSIVSGAILAAGTAAYAWITSK
jgi:hypothetical protein